MLYKYLDPYIDDVDFVTNLRATLFNLIAQGKTIVEWGSEGDSTRKAALVPIGDLLNETKLFIRDKTGQYPADAVKVFFT